MKHSKGLIFIVSAPSGAGKTSLVKALLQQMSNITVAISHTTRPIRPGESNGLHYHFVSQNEFAALQVQGEFIESAEVFQYWYATSKAAISGCIDRGEDVILEIDWQGALQVRRLFPNNTVSIFILPPSQAALQKRLEQRAQDKPEVIAHRLAQAKNEISHYVEYEYLIVNDFFDTALADLMAVVQAARLNMAIAQNLHQSLLQELLA